MVVHTCEVSPGETGTGGSSVQLELGLENEKDIKQKERKKRGGTLNLNTTPCKPSQGVY